MARRRPSGDFMDEDEGFSVSQLGRSAVWAFLATASLAGAFYVARSEPGLRRITEALNGPSGTTMMAEWTAGTSVLAKVREPASDGEARRLAENVRQLSLDRERLIARLDALERSVEVTGSLPPAAAAGASTQASAGKQARADTPPLPESALQSGSDSVVTRTEFGLDLGPEPNIEALRGLWTTVRGQHGALLEGLRPLVSVREAASGAVELRLVAGPVQNAATAARLCAAIAKTGRACQPSTFEGQRLALR